ncbi:histidine phosphatase family protein [Undibacterium squillarum]|uniref:Phosphoglycerate mutase n=1 Tax=Undibacterium squillarum TaxID=1131567 RepID=A0ABQ2Y0C4_9BURK|nr:histidine phosphatase family protein [Undibacterium squillarum]GGX45485.1 phosphoglycerate mutase [Undibacterium squillarum]
MESTEILLIRHGETPWNALRRLQGHTDIPLNAEGRRQAKALAYALSNEKLDAVYASDLQRAIQTAGEIARLQGVSTRLEAGFRERCFGAFEGQLYSDLPHLHPEAYISWKSGDPDFVFPPGERQGESVRQFHARVISNLRFYAKRHAGQKIAVVAHGGVLECAYREAKQLPLSAPREVTIYNASINRFTLHGDVLQLMQWGDIAHLDADAMDELAPDR